MSRKSFRDLASFQFLVETILTSFEEAFAALTKFLEGEGSVGQSAQRVQNFLSEAYVKILKEVDPDENSATSVSIPDDFSNIDIPDEALKKEAEEQVKQLYKEGKIDTLSEIFQQNSRLEQEAKEKS